MKSLLKYLSLFTLIFMMFFKTSFGDECSASCKLDAGTPDVLLNYIDNLRIAVKNVTSQTQNVSRDQYVTKTYEQLKSEVIGLYNLITDWDGYFGKFDFFVVYPISNEYVYEIWRDYKILDDESSGLEKYKKTIISRGLTQVEITKEQVCKGLENKNCDLEGGNIMNVITQLEKNHDRVKDYYRKSIMNDMALFSGKILLVDDDFKKKFNEYYNGKTTSECSSCQAGFFAKIEKAVTNIENIQEVAKNGFKTWRDAISMIDGTMSEREYIERERQVLANGLGNQGVSGSAGQAIMNNLDRYNEGGFSAENNFITNSFNYVKSGLGRQIDEFTNTIFQNINVGKKQETVNLDTYEATNVKIKGTQEISKRIEEMYKREIPGAQLQDVSSDEIISKLIQMHYNLSSAIKVLDQTIEIAEKVCNSQGSGLGRCTYK